MGELRVLVVEEPNVQGSTIVETARRLDLKDVHSAADGETAFKLLSAGAADVVIFDLDMRGIDAHGFMQRLGGLGAPSALIVASALSPALLAAPEELAKTFGISLLEVVQKPVTQETLQTVLTRFATPARQPSRASTPGRTFAVEEILEALSQGQFEPFFQPRVEISTRRVVGAEALARWCHPEQGVISPAAFVGALEHAGRIDELMWTILKKSVAFYGTMKAAGLESSIATKLSLKSLYDAEVASRAMDIARAGNVATNRICFEISELAAAANEATVIENLKRLSSKGFLLAIDDFGTARASQQQLAGIPLSEMKIDRAFVTGADTKGDAQAVLKSSLSMARALGIKALAEGVETQQDWDLLHTLGCDLAQGYFIAKPMTATAYVKWMNDLASDPTSIFLA